MAERVERKLAAMLAADVVGYTQLMQADEEGTLARLRTHREEVGESTITEHNGRIVKLMGDGLLAEFASVVDAVRCAAEIQRQMDRRNSDASEDQRIQFRIGVHQGDIIVEGDDIYGDGVNIAARLEQLAEPGGVCISRSAFREVEGKVDVGFVALGEQTVKGIAKPIPAYRLLLNPDQVGVVIDDNTPQTKQKNRKRVQIAAAVAIFAIGTVAGGILWTEPWVPRVEAADQANMAFPLPEKPSIAVMPFENLSGDKEQDLLADGVVDAVTTALSQSDQVFVVSRNSTFTFKGKSFLAKEIAEQFGVRHVLEGTFQRSADNVRVTARLIDAVSGRQIWADRYDRSMEDIFELQDDITKNLVSELQIELTLGEQGRAYNREFETFEAYQLFLRAREQFGLFTKEASLKGRELLEEAIALEPNSAALYATLGWAHWGDYGNGWAIDREAAYSLAVESANRAITLDETHHAPYALLGWIYVQDGNHDAAISAIEKAVSLMPSLADYAWFHSMVLVQIGRSEEAITRLNDAKRMDPYFYPYKFWVLSEAYRQQGRFDEMIPLARSIQEKTPTYWWETPRLVFAYMKLGREDDARAELKKLLDGHPERVQAWLDGVQTLPEPLRDDFVGTLVKAGFPDPGKATPAATGE